VSAESPVEAWRSAPAEAPSLIDTAVARVPSAKLVKVDFLALVVGADASAKQQEAT